MTAAHVIERDTERREIHRALDRVDEGRGGGLVVEGPAGAGKSTLLQLAREEARARGLRVGAASGSEFERELAYGVIRQLFEPALASIPRTERAALLTGAAAPASWVVDGGKSDRADAGFAVLNGLYWLTANLATAAPLALVVDDLHWVDEPSLRALDHLARRVGDLPVVLLLAMRTSEPGAPAALLDALRARPDLGRIAPPPLSAAAVAEIVRSRRADATDELCAACHAASAGNPFYLQELLRALEADPAADDPDAIARLARPTLADRVTRRVARMGPDAVALTRAAAVLGGGAELGAAADLAGLADADAAVIARDLVRMEVLATAEPCAFVHPLVRRSIYDDLPIAERDALHAAAAQRLRETSRDPAAAAPHLMAVRPTSSPQVAEGLFAAAASASARAAPETAAVLLRRALEEGASSPARATLLFALGRAEMALREPTAAESLTRALELETDPQRRIDVAIKLTELRIHAGQWDEALALLDGMRTDHSGAEDRLPEIEALRFGYLSNDPRFADEVALERERLTPLTRQDTVGGRAIAAAIGASAAYRGDVSTARPFLSRALDDGVLIADPGVGSWATPQAVSGLIVIDDHDHAMRIAEAVAEDGRRSGAIIATAGGALYRGFVTARRGDLADAEVDLRTTFDVSLQSGMTMWLLNVVHAFADVIAERPGFDDVIEVILALEVPDPFLVSTAGAQLLENRGRLRVARQEREAGIADLSRAVDVNRALRVSPTFTSSRSLLALALAPADRDEALEVAEEDLALSRSTGLPRHEGAALRTLGLLTPGDEGTQLLRASVECLAGSEAHLEHARSLIELGAALRRDGQRMAAREQLAAGLDLASRCGALRLAKRADQELRSAGARPRRSSLTGAEALTATQLRVAQLASSGRTNAEIAQELFVSVKTIETHLSQAYAKLGLSGQGARAGLQSALRPKAA
ncbi:MAG: AAA family ATPase [Solirubrobacteraceae bacterium]